MHIDMNYAGLFLTGLTCALAGLWAILPLPRRDLAETLAVTACFVFVAQPIAGAVAGRLTPAISPHYDPIVYRIDGLLGFEPSYALGRLVLSTHTVPIFAATYDALAAVALLAIAVNILKETQCLHEISAAFILNIVLAVPCYLLVPVAGPVHVFPGFPWQFPHPAGPTILVAAVSNAMPSIHMATTLLIALYLWRWPLGRIFGILYAFSTVISTLASGEHYLLDLVMSVPYTFLVVVAARKLAAFHRTGPVSDCAVVAGESPVRLSF